MKALLAEATDWRVLCVVVIGLIHISQAVLFSGPWIVHQIPGVSCTVLRSSAHSASHLY